MTAFVRTACIAMTLFALSACAASGVSSSETPWSATAPPEQRQQIIITGFDCGDNCYLHYRPLTQPDGELQTALCSVGACEPWYSEQSMGPEFRERIATITIGIGKQYDGGGNVMSDDFPEITSIKIDPPK